MQQHDHLPLGDKAFVVTGATSGIGFAVTEMLAERGGRVIGIGRSKEHCVEAEERLQVIRSRPGGVTYLVADLSLQVDVRRAASEVVAVLDQWDHPHLDGLINNAATVPFWQTLTSEGFDVQWALNHLAPFLLTRELLPRLRAAPSARVITVSSGSHRQGKVDWEDIQLLRHYGPLRAYSLTKLANVLFTLELRRRLGLESSIAAFAADPGLVNTDLGRKSNSIIARAVWELRRRGGVTPRQSALGIAFLATEPSIQHSAEIYWKDSRPAKASTRATNPQAARQLWDLSAQMCGVVE